MTPTASVIIAGYYSSDTLAITLESLAQQTCQDFETILVNSSQENETEELTNRHYPWVRFHQHPHRLLMHAARNKGAKLALGELLVFTDPDLEIDPQWMGQILMAYKNGAQCMVGEMDCRDRTLNSIGIHLVKFHDHLPGSTSTAYIAPTASAAFSRRLFQKIGGFNGDKICGDAIISWQVRKAGFSIERVKGAVVHHIHTHSLSQFMRERYSRAQEFMTERMRFENWISLKKIQHILFFPVLMFYILLISGFHAFSAGWLKRYFQTLHIQFLGQAAWCLGECKAQITSLGANA